MQQSAEATLQYNFNPPGI